MTVAFVRQLGAESGLQLNPLIDSSEIPSIGNDDQVMGIAMRALRGRIDKPFKVTRADVYKKLGKGESVRLNKRNEAFIHVVEALNNGVYEVVVQRMTTAQAKIKWITVSNSFTYAVADARDDDAMINIRHLGCYNDGIRVAFHADPSDDGISPVTMVYFRAIDPDGVVVFEAKGSLDPTARDDYNESQYLPDVITKLSDEWEMVIKEDATVTPTSTAYGYDTFGSEKYATSDVLLAFEEGPTVYGTQDYQRFRSNLTATPHDYAYIAGGGETDAEFVKQMAQLAYDTNRQLRIDIPGDLTPEQAITKAKEWNIGSNKAAHLVHVFWAPLKTDDPIGLSGSGYYGTSALNIALACERNARKNGKGFAPKNYPIAGREYPLSGRTRVNQMQQLTSQQLNALAKAKINPVVYETYTGGGRYVFRDCLTSAQVDSSLKKLISVVDMSTSIDESVTRAGKDFLQLPMQVAVKKMENFLTRLFEDAEASGWLVPSNAPEMKGKASQFSVKPNEIRPYDVMDVMYWLRYDGVARQIMVTQTITR